MLRQLAYLWPTHLEILPRRAKGSRTRARLGQLSGCGEAPLKRSKEQRLGAVALPEMEAPPAEKPAALTLRV
jgi:hypothetical protein